MARTVTTDAELVGESLVGDRDAFGQIVARYQSLVCSLAYSATGCLGQSEDLAQETFITAWRHLRHLREPAKLRAWLCGIARNRINNFLRREGRKPLTTAEPLETIHDVPAIQPSASEQAISQEEESILWRSLERIPETYREPLVLFYREHQSIERVAEQLELSEDAVKQRLSRGRKLLHEQVLAFVEGALERTNPGKTFTVGVVAALPLLATSAKAATLTAAASKGGSAAKAASGAGTLGALLTGGAMLLFSLFGVFGFLGRWIGRKMGRASQQSPLGRKRIVQFWRALAIGFLLLVLPCCLMPNSLIHARPWLFDVQVWALSAFYGLVAAAWVLWVWRRRRDAREQHEATLDVRETTNRAYTVWVALGMVGPAFILGSFLFALFFSNWTLSSKTIPGLEAQRIIAERGDARFAVYQYQDGSSSLHITLPENPRINLTTPMNGLLSAALKQKDIAYPTRVENLDFHNGGVHGWLVLLSTFLVVAGTVLLLRRPGTRQFELQEFATPRAERREKQILAACGALAMLTGSLFLTLFAFSHAARHVSAVEARSIIAEHSNAKFEVFQYQHGSKELWITPPGSRRYPNFVAPADESTLALMAEKKISHETWVQGRDFGFRGPRTYVSVSLSLALAAGAASLIWWTIRLRQALPTAAGARA